MYTQTIDSIPTGKIIFVEDDPDDRAIIEEIFERLNWHHVQVFSTADDLLDSLSALPASNSPSLFVFDSQLPSKDGATLLQVIKKDLRFQQVPVMFLSSFMNEKRRSTLLELGAWKAEEKPASLKDYDQLMQELIMYCEAAA